VIKINQEMGSGISVYNKIQQVMPLEMESIKVNKYCRIKGQRWEVK
jgi:hypothetical protein